jgi:hypothetical protein
MGRWISPYEQMRRMRAYTLIVVHVIERSFDIGMQFITDRYRHVFVAKIEKKNPHNKYKSYLI